MVGCVPDGSEIHEASVRSAKWCETSDVSNDHSGKDEADRDGEVSHDFGRLASDCVPSDDGVGVRRR